MGVLEVFYSALIPYQAMATGNSLNASHSTSICYINCSQECAISICNNKETLWKQSANTLII